nr:competence protein [uncultured Flavobacterium sp.]
MPLQHLKEDAEEIQDKLQHVVDSTIAYYKLWLFKIATKSTSTLFKILLLSVCFMMVLFFCSFALAVYLGQLLEDNTLGFLAVGGIYLVLMLIIAMIKDKIVEGPILKNFSKVFFND